MREILLLLKHGIYIRTSKKARNPLLSFLGQLGIFVYFLAFTLITLRGKFPSGENVGIDLFKLTYLYWVTLSGAFFLASTISSAVYVLSMEKDVEFLLALPLRRWTVTLYQILVSLIYDFPMLGVLLAVPIAFGSNKGLFGVILALISSIFHSIALMSIGFYVSTFISRKLTKSVARRVFVLVQGLVIVLFIFMMNSYLQNASGFEELFKKLSKVYEILKSPINVFSYGLMGVESPIYMLYSVAISIIFWLLFIRESSSFGFVSTRTERKGRVKFSKFSKRKAIYIKDLKAILRSENSLFLLLYPYAFGIFMGFTSSEPLAPILFSIPISTIYVMMESSIATASELISWQISRSLPVSFKETILSKITVPILLNFPLVLLTVVFTWITKGFRSESLILFAIAVFMHTVSSFFGVRIVFSNPPKSESLTRESVKGPIWINLLLMGLSAGSIIGFGFIKKWWGALLLFGTIFLSAYLIVFLSNGIKKSFENLIRGKL